MNSRRQTKDCQKKNENEQIENALRVPSFEQWTSQKWELMGNKQNVKKKRTKQTK